MSRRGTGLVLLVLLLGACGVPVTLQRRYVGTLTGCGAALPATLVRLRDGFAFSPGDSSLLLRGGIGADGTLAGSLNTQPPGKPPWLLAVAGKLTPTSASVTYTTPRCVAAGTLAVVKLRVLP